jgi:hypothetical protein
MSIKSIPSKRTPLNGCLKYLTFYNKKPIFATNDLIYYEKIEKGEPENYTGYILCTNYNWNVNIDFGFLPTHNKKGLDDKKISKIMNYKDYQNKNTNYDYLYDKLYKQHIIHYDTWNIINEYIGRYIYFIELYDFSYKKPLRGAVFNKLKDAKIAFIKIANKTLLLPNKYKILYLENSRLNDNNVIIKIQCRRGFITINDIGETVPDIIMLSITRLNVRKHY